ncbi:MAG: LamG-like jellyroll fold domain-containing protein [Planctomycetota bacterium]
MSDRPIIHEALPLIGDLLNGTISDAGFARLETVLLQSAEARALYRSYTNLHAALPGIVGHSPRLSIQITDAGSDPASFQSHEVANDQLMQFLTWAEDQGEDLDPMALAAERFSSSHSQSPTKREYLSALTYLYEHYITPRVVWAAAGAATLLLSTVLAIVFLSDGGSQDIADAPDRPYFSPVSPSPDPYRVVATVTDQANAQWVTPNGQGALPDRMLLAINQRLTLVEGFAEITTMRGATVLLQAPVTIETTDSDNAIRLHRGKLVGRCDTPSSKGFTVHAPGMDIVDLGTMFGVSADADNGSTVTVIDGSVRAEPARESPLAFKPVVLRQNDTRRVAQDTGGLETIAPAEAPVFYEVIPHPYVMAVLDAAPVAYWRFEDDTNRTIINEVGQGRSDLRLHGPAQLTDDGVIGKAGRLHNRRQPYAFFETAEPVQALNSLDEYSIELWYYTDERYEMALENSTASVFNLFDPNQGNEHEDAAEAWLFSLELTNDFWNDKDENFIITRPPGWREYSIRGFPMKDLATEQRREIYTAQDYPVAKWQHVVMVKTKDGVKLYLDGVLAEEAAYNPPTVDLANVRLGRSVLDVITKLDPNNPYYEGNFRPLRGRIDEVALYDKPLTPEQVALHHSLATSEDSP